MVTVTVVTSDATPAEAKAAYDMIEAALASLGFDATIHIKYEE